MSNYKIVEARIAKGWTQADFAKKLGTSQQQVSRWESGEGDVKAGMIVRMSKVLGVTISYLLGLDEPLLNCGSAAELINYYNLMGETEKKALLATAKALAGQGE